MSPLEFTGERFIPGHGGVQLAYEHLHRYLFAMRWATGKNVLDVASGSGYGAGLLAKVARRVWAVDIDDPTVTQARRTTRDGNICFVNADGRHLPLQSGMIDLIVAFEVIEHIPDQEGLIQEIARVLRPGGLALISTPNKAVYSDARKYVNPFHLREFYRDELVELLRRGFPFVRLFQQQVRAGSLISGSDLAGTGEIVAGPIAGEEHAETASMYFLACCSSESESLPAENSAYIDPADSLIREWKRREIEAGTEIERLNQEIRKLGRWGRDLDTRLAEKDESLKRVLEEIGQRDRTILDLQARMEEELKSRDEMIRCIHMEMESEVVKRDQIIRDLQEDIARETSHRDEEILRLQREFERRTEWAMALEGEVQSRGEHLARIQRTLVYRVLARLRMLPK